MNLKNQETTYAFIDHQNIAITAYKHHQVLDYGVLYEVLKTKYQVDQIFLFDCYYGTSKETVQNLEQYDFQTNICAPLGVYTKNINTNIDDYLLEKIHDTKKEHQNTIVVSSDVGLIRSARALVQENVFQALVDNRTISYGIRDISTDAINTIPSLFLKKKHGDFKNKTNTEKVLGDRNARILIQRKKQETIIKYAKYVEPDEYDLYKWKRVYKSFLQHRS